MDNANQITGELLIGRSTVLGAEKSFRAAEPSTHTEIEEPLFTGASLMQVGLACDLAEKAFDEYWTLPYTVRAEFLDLIADGILQVGDVLIERASRESALPRGRISTGQLQARAALFVTDAQTFLETAALEDEVFGPMSLIIRCEDLSEMLTVAEHLSGQLTATLQLESVDMPEAQKMIRILERKVGRILLNGYPTGVEVSHAMVHGGPFKGDVRQSKQVRWNRGYVAASTSGMLSRFPLGLADRSAC
jgi:acyl-CoA reductase-like NAD-dependent aldehyde dehydrogenase